MIAVLFVGACGEGRPDLVVVPNVKWWHYEDAKEIMESDGFIVKRLNTPLNKRTPGLVVIQRPDALTKLPWGGTVTLIVSNNHMGPKK